MATEKPPKSTFDWVSDKFAAGVARVNGGEYQDIEIAVVKATNHDRVPPKEKHVRTILEAIRTAPSRRKVYYIIHDLYERLRTPNQNWLVVIKTLMVFHRIFKADLEGTSKAEVVKYKEKRRLKTILGFENYNDASTKEAWDFSGYIRAYSLYLDERIEVFEKCSFDIERDVKGEDTKLKTAPAPELLEQLPQIQKLLQRVMACVPDGAATSSVVVMESVKWVLMECFRLYRAVSEGVINLAGQFFEMDRVDARKGLDMYKEAINSTERLQSFFNAIQSLPSGRQLTFPTLNPPPEDFLEQMEEYVKGSSDAGNTPKNKPTVITRVGTRIARSAETSSALAPGGNASKPEENSGEADLLGFDTLSLDPAPTSEQAKDTPGSSAPGTDFIEAPAAPSPQTADPFGDSAFGFPPSAPSQSSEQSNPTPPQPQYQPPAQSNPLNSLLDGSWGQTAFNPPPVQPPHQDMSSAFAPGFSAMQNPGHMQNPNPMMFPTSSQGGFGHLEAQVVQPVAHNAFNPSGNPFGGGFGNMGPGYQATRQSPTPPGPGMHMHVSDPFTDLSTDALGFNKNVNAGPPAGAPMRSNPNAGANPFGGMNGSAQGSNPFDQNGGGQPTNFSFM